MKKNGICLDKKYCIMFVVLAGVFMTYVLPILLADRYYLDDLARSLYGATGWNGDGRPITELLMQLLCNGKPVGDISPLPLLLAVLLFAYILTAYTREKLSEFDLSFPLIGSLFLAIANPFLLANFSNKYDTIAQIGALAIMFIPYLLPETINWWKRMIYVTLISLTALSLYQVVAGAFLGLLLLEIFFDLFQRKMDWKKTIVTLIGFGVSGMLYLLVIANHFVDKTGWRANESRLVSGITRETLQTITGNIVQMKAFIERVLQGIPQIVIAIFFVGTAVSLVWMGYLIWKIWREKKQLERLIAVAYVVLLPLLLIGVGVAPLLFMENLHIKSRMMMPFSILFLYIGMVMLFLSKRFPHIVTVLLIPCIISSFSYSYAYGNALKCQKNYETYLVYEIVHDIETINTEGTCNSLSIIGTAPKSQQLQMLCSKYPQFNELVYVYISNDSWIGGAWLYHYMQKNIPYRELSEEEQASLVEKNPICSNSTYNCYMLGDTMVVQFR